jgi:hypothetical protein
MTAGMTVDGNVGTTAEKSRGVFVTDWTGDSETLARTGEPTPITPNIIAVATVITVKDSAEAILMATANMPATEDGIKLIALRSHRTEN